MSQAITEQLQLVCPHCAAVNRVQAERLGDGPVCGQCKQPLFSGAPIELTAANFDTEGMKWPDIAQKIQADLKEIKIDVKIVTSEFSVMVDPYRKGELPFLVMHWSPDYFDINNQLAFLPGSTVGERAKWAADGHQDMIDLGNKIIGESDKTLRAQYSEQLQDLMAFFKLER